MDLWDRVCEQIERDVHDPLNDLQALYTMLQSVPKDVLLSYLPEDQHLYDSQDQMPHASCVGQAVLLVVDLSPESDEVNQDFLKESAPLTLMLVLWGRCGTNYRHP